MTEKFKNRINLTYINACNKLALHFCSTLGVSPSSDDTWWVSYGGLFAFQCGEMFIHAEDMMRVIEHRMTWEDFSEWYSQWTDYDSDGNPLPNRVSLNSWLMGARPGITQDEQINAKFESKDEAKTEVDTLTVRSSVTQWISVDERLPEDDRYFYLVADARMDPLGVDCAEYTCETKLFSRSGKILHPTHWCAIPQLNLAKDK